MGRLDEVVTTAVVKEDVWEKLVLPPSAEVIIVEVLDFTSVNDAVVMLVIDALDVAVFEMMLVLLLTIDVNSVVLDDDGDVDAVVEISPALVVGNVAEPVMEVVVLVMVICVRGPPGTVHGIGVSVVSGEGGPVGIDSSVVVRVTVKNVVQVDSGLGLRFSSSTVRGSRGILPPS
jgi:hypothetical protein